MPVPENRAADEAERLARLHELVVLDSAPEAVFDSIARLASEVCGAPIALVSLVDAERQWFKANVGLPGVNQTPRDVAFCAHAIEAGNALFEVPDATRDPRFAANPLVTGAPDIRFYAGAPLVLPGGERIGTLCVIDRLPRQLDEAQARTLQSLAAIASQALLMRHELISRALSVRTEYERRLAESESQHRALVEDQAELVSLARPGGELVYVNPAYASHFGLAPAEMIGRNLFDFIAESDRDAVAARFAEVQASGRSFSSENRMIAAGGGERWVEWTNGLQFDARQQELLHSVGRDITERRSAERALRELTAIFDNTIDLVVQSDARGRISYMNPAARRATGLAPDEPVAQRNVAEFNTPATNRLFAEVIVPAAQARGFWVGEASVYAAGRREVPVSHLVIAHRDPQGGVVRYSAVMRDISEHVFAKQQEERYAATLRSVTEAIPAMVAVVGADRRYRFVNSSFERWRGLPRDRIVGHDLVEVLGEAEAERSRPWVERALAGESVSYEKETTDRDGARHLAISFIPLHLDSGTVDGYVCVAQDITRHRLEEVRLLRLSQRDALTGLLNRAGFEEFMERALADGDAGSEALLYIDLDHFKPVNDLHGHAVGDQVLQKFAQRLLGLVRPTDAVARLGGDEFAILLVGVRESANAQAVADKVIAAARTPFALGGLELHVGASVGVAFGAVPALGGRELLERADAMLYRAKAAGRGRHAGGAG